MYCEPFEQYQESRAKELWGQDRLRIHLWSNFPPALQILSFAQGSAAFDIVNWNLPATNTLVGGRSAVLSVLSLVPIAHPIKLAQAATKIEVVANGDVRDLF